MPASVPSPRADSDGRPSQVWIVEPNPDGHRLWYVRLLLEEQRRRSGISPVVVTCPAAVDSPEWRIHLGNAVPGAATPESGVLVRAWPEGGRSRWLASVLREAGQAGVYVVLPDADRDLPVLVRTALRQRLRRSAPGLAAGGLRGSALLMRGHPQPGVGGTGALAAKLALTAALRVLAPHVVIRTLEVSSSTQHPWCRWLGLDVTPDPVSFAPAHLSRPDWLSRHGLPRDAQVLLLAGELSERKYLPEILQAFGPLVALEGYDKVLLVLAGRLSAGAQRSYDDLPDDVRTQIVLRHGYLTDEDLDTWIAVADVVFVLHRNEGSSGILLKCAAAGTPVIAGGARSVREAARSLGVCGRLVRPPAPQAIAAAVRSVLESGRVSRRSRTGRQEHGVAPRDRPVDPSGSAAAFASSLLPPAQHAIAPQAVPTPALHEGAAR